MIEILKALFFGIVEGITEWLPVSSTGHLILFDRFLHLSVSEEFWSLFLVVIQLGAILAVVLLFFRRIWPFHRYEPENPGITKLFYKDRFDLWIRILLTCLPAAVIGLPLDDWIDTHLQKFGVVAVMLIVYGILFILVENRNRGIRPTICSLAAIGYREALIIGLFQILALVPGTSRSGATILGAILIGVSRKTAALYTFLVAVPVMLGASAVKVIKYDGPVIGSEVAILLVGMTVAFLVSFFTIRFFLNYIRTHDFKGFGYYRIAFGIFMLLVLAIGR